MNRESVLLLGGTGFIGSALSGRMKRENMTVHVLGRHGGGSLADVLPQCGTVVHLASATTPGSSANQPGLELQNIPVTRSNFGNSGTITTDSYYCVGTGGTRVAPTDAFATPTPP